MRHWAVRAADGGFQFSVFMALENVVQLHARAPDRYPEFLEAVRELHRGGTLFYPHNHYVFGLDSGERPELDVRHAGPGAEYTKRASMFYDVVHRHRQSLPDWLKLLRSGFSSFLADAEVPLPRRWAFRAGGWDYGSSPGDLAIYLEGLAAAGFEVDSTACSGAFGTQSWRIGAPFGHNAFALSDGLIEIAPCWSLDCAAPRLSRRSAAPLVALGSQRDVWARRRCSGAFVTVLHFDHLFGPARGEVRPSFAVVRARIDRFFTNLTWLRKLLQLRSVTFDNLEIRA